jgi:uncharacterized RDD family membrane protein YckC
MIQEILPNSPVEKAIAGCEPAEILSDDIGHQSADVGVLNSADEELLIAEIPHQPSTLIEFPGSTRTVPAWRKQLSQRVREVQERKAREAAEEAAAAREAGIVSCSLPSAQLELVPDLEQPLVNPIVSKALERLERARQVDPVSTGFATGAATAPALAPPAPDPAPNVAPEPESGEPKAPETKHKLTVVAPARTEAEPLNRKPVRVISGSADDVALSYLENYLSMPAIDSPRRSDHAGLGRRTIAGCLDLLLVALMASPVAAVIEFTDGNWLDPRVIGVMGGIAIATMFAYHTISIALTGRTLAMRMLGLRTIDACNGLIPTGGQSLKRAVTYIFSLIPLGLGLAFALIDPDGRAIHDRFSKTLVVRN